MNIDTMHLRKVKTHDTQRSFCSLTIVATICFLKIDYDSCADPGKVLSDVFENIGQKYNALASDVTHVTLVLELS